MGSCPLNRKILRGDDPQRDIVNLYTILVYGQYCKIPPPGQSLVNPDSDPDFLLNPDLVHRVLTSPPSLHVATAGKNHLKEEITTLLPTGIGERYSQTKPNLGQAALLRRCELPL
jgi:hypothetical protein